MTSNDKNKHKNNLETTTFEIDASSDAILEEAAAFFALDDEELELADTWIDAIIESGVDF